MRTTALSIAVLLGIATLGVQGHAQAQAMPAVTATVTIESGTVQIAGKRGWSKHGWSNRGWSNRGWSNRGWSNRGWSDRGWSNRGLHRGKFHHRHKGLARHHKRFDHPGRHHRPAFVVKRIHKGPVVIVTPAWGRSFGRSFRHRHLPARPLIKNGSFRGHHHW
jgi:hypothetical protein